MCLIADRLTQVSHVPRREAPLLPAGRRACRRRCPSSAARRRTPPVRLLRRLLLQRWPGRPLVGGLAVKLRRLDVEVARRRRGGQRLIDTLARVGAHRRRRDRPVADRAVRPAPAAVARPAQADRLLHLHRLRSGAADCRVLPARRHAAVLQLQLVPVADRRPAHRDGRRGVSPAPMADELRAADGPRPVAGRRSTADVRAASSAVPRSVARRSCRASVRRWPAAMTPDRRGAAAPTLADREPGPWAHAPPPTASPPWIGHGRLRRQLDCTHGGGDEPICSSCARGVAHSRSQDWTRRRRRAVGRDAAGPAATRRTGIAMIERHARTRRPDARRSGGAAGASSCVGQATSATARSMSGASRRATAPVADANLVVFVDGPATGRPATTAGVSASDRASASRDLYAHLGQRAGPHPGAGHRPRLFAGASCVIGVLFLIIQVVALVLGWRWRARSPARSTSCSPAPSGSASGDFTPPHRRSQRAISSASWPSRSTR